jgi:hypothetical protein
MACPHTSLSYSTELFTNQTIHWINAHQTGDQPLFLCALLMSLNSAFVTYVVDTAYAAPHSPLQVPPEYLEDPICASIGNNSRSVYCGMVKAVDMVWLFRQCLLFADCD